MKTNEIEREAAYKEWYTPRAEDIYGLEHSAFIAGAEWQAASSRQRGVKGCKCSFAIRMTGEGCRYCQPQNYIDHMHDQLEDIVDKEESVDVVKQLLDALMSLNFTDNQQEAAIIAGHNFLASIPESSEVRHGQG